MYKNAARPALLIAAVAVAQFVVSLDISVVNVALPAIRADLGFGPSGLQWVVDIYALVLGGFLLLGGRLGDRFGHRSLFLSGLALFALASLGGGLANTPQMLVVARAVQGLGAAAMTPAALAVLSTAFPAGPARARALGIWGAMGGIGGAAGVVLGGVLTEFAGWRWVMFVNIPVVVVGIALVSAAVPRDRHSVHQRSLDLPGAVLVTGGLGFLVLGVVRTHDVGWLSMETLGALLAAVVLLTAFVAVERRTAEPLVRFGLLARREVAAANIFAFLLFGGQFAAFYFVSLYLQTVLGYSAVATGLAFLPFSAGLIAGTVVATRLAGRRPLRMVLTVGGLIAAAGFGWFGLINADGSILVDVLGPIVVTSVGLGLCLAPLAGAATAGAPPEDAGTAAALVNSSRQIGGSIGLAVLSTVAAVRTGEVRAPESLTAGFALGLTLSAVLLLLAVTAALTLLPRTGPTSPARRPDTSTPGGRP